MKTMRITGSSLDSSQSLRLGLCARASQSLRLGFRALALQGLRLRLWAWALPILRRAIRIRDSLFTIKPCVATGDNVLI